MLSRTSAFDGLPGLILPVQSLSRLSNVGLDGTSRRKTPAGKCGFKKRSKFFRDERWRERFWLCFVSCFLPCGGKWAKWMEGAVWMQCWQSPRMSSPNQVVFSFPSYQWKQQERLLASQSELAGAALFRHSQRSPAWSFDNSTQLVHHTPCFVKLKDAALGPKVQPFIFLYRVFPLLQPPPTSPTCFAGPRLLWNTSIV